MKKFIIVFLLLPASLSAQKGVDNLWMMGYAGGGGGINIDFSSGSASVAKVNRKMGFFDQSSTMCDTNGNVLFYTNGVWIANVNNDTMQNGSGLSPGYWTSNYGFYGLYPAQTALILPDPADAMKYYLFHGTIDDSVLYAHKIYYSEIDMRGDGGLGAVVSKNNVLLNDTLIPGKITATRHGNGRDWWVVFHKAKSDLYYIYRIDPSGIHFHSSQNIGYQRTFPTSQVCFSPDGSRYAFYEGDGYYDGVSNLDIMDFDRCSGVFSNNIYVAIYDSAGASGVAFSSNSRVLYVSSYVWVYQFDLNVADVAASKTTVAIWDGHYSPQPPFATTFYLAQLAPDGKIYISSTNGVLSMHVINEPDVVGMGCDVCQHCISLPAYNASTVPNHPNYHLGALKGSVCDSLTIGVNEKLNVQRLKLNVYPNPVVSSGELIFTYSSTGEQKKISVYNIEGKEVVHYAVPQWSSIMKIKLPALPSGIYMARLTSNSQQIANCKFIIK